MPDDAAQLARAAVDTPGGQIDEAVGVPQRVPPALGRRCGCCCEDHIERIVDLAAVGVVQWPADLLFDHGRELERAVHEARVEDAGGGIDHAFAGADIHGLWLLTGGDGKGGQGDERDDQAHGAAPLFLNG